MATPIGLPLLAPGQSMATGLETGLAMSRAPMLRQADQLKLLQAQATLDRQPLLDEQVQSDIDVNKANIESKKQEDEIKKIMTAAAVARAAVNIEDEAERIEFIQSMEPIIGKYAPGEESLDKLNRVIEVGGHIRTSLQKEPTSAAQLDTLLKLQKNRFDQASKIRGEVEKFSKTFRDVEDSFSRVKASQDGEVTAASDLALIFNFMKMLDPGSVVREGEFATAQNTAGVPERVRNAYNKLISGERLSSSQRKNFVGESKKQFESARKIQKRREGEFIQLGNRYDIPKDEIIIRQPIVATPSPVSINRTTEDLLRTATAEDIAELRKKATPQQLKALGLGPKVERRKTGVNR